MLLYSNKEPSFTPLQVRIFKCPEQKKILMYVIRSKLDTFCFFIVENVAWTLPLKT